MNIKKEEKQIDVEETVVCRVPKEMLEILEIIRDNVNYFTYDSMKETSVPDLMRILVHKIKETGIVKKERK